jgi:FixJ family two-component response regulator
VDDDPGTATLLAAILNASGFEATAFTEAEKVMEAAESCYPGMLISDPTDEDLSLHPSGQKSLVGNPGSVRTPDLGRPV